MMEIGNFYIGDDHEFALTTFDSLLGEPEVNEHSKLRIDLTRKVGEDKDESIKSISCILDQYVENCRIITRDAFKFFTLER